MFKLNGVYATVTEAVKILGFNESYIRRLLKEGKVRGAVKTGRDWLIPVIDGEIKIRTKNKQ